MRRMFAGSEIDATASRGLSPASWSVALGCLALIFAAASCRGSDSHNAHSSSSTTSRGTASVTTSTSTGGKGAPKIVSFPKLLSERASLVGVTVDVSGRVFFVPQCPAGKGTCVLTGYFAAEDRNQLLPADAASAIPLSEQGRALSCSETAAIGSACRGWKDGARYRLVASVQHQVLGGRETKYVELEVKSKSLA